MARSTNKKVIIIRNFILHRLLNNSRTVIHDTVEEFSLTRQTVSRHLKALVDSADVLAQGETKSRKYRLATKFRISEDIEILPETEEDSIWTKLVRPHITDVEKNVMEICHYGFTEMMNNVIDHSDSKVARIHIRRTAVSIVMRITDKGIGIFKKIQGDFDLDDPRQALLELSKGKLTSDPDNHSGEGIFFTSRMFDKFMIRSGEMVYMCMPSNEDYLFESREKIFATGTAIHMSIEFDSTRDSTEVFNRFTADDDDHAFSKTHVPVFLASYDNDQLVSRSAAKRVLTRFTKFKEVWLDFQGVEKVGQAFADEIFRVYAKANPSVSLFYSNANNEVTGMVERAVNKLKETSA
ncbi:MAG: hypothetical protein A6F72_04690 [Cycloclasticus sp. symbiont of Poecilosclerida sp. N]|nr:MAG: hypothetical protein A6F72_04690 [Cycloclasticus sp. symbiont of Poecilosclerida sp. N]